MDFKNFIKIIRLNIDELKYGKIFIPYGLYTRPMIKYLKSKDKNNLIGVEIGVLNGFNSKTIFKTLKINKLYLVDIKIKKFSRILLKRYKNKIKFIENKSIIASSEIPDDLDFIYIDGDHSYETVKQDIEQYYKKVKNGGIIGGHDFDANHIGVCKAVIEFANKNNLNVYSEEKDWWILKHGN